MTLDEGLNAVKRCVHECKDRFVANLPKFNVMVIDKDGARVLPDAI